MKKNIGFLTYDLQPFTEDCLFRIQNEALDWNITAYPVIEHPYQYSSRVKYFLTNQKGKFLGIQKKNKTPEGLMSNINFKTAYNCAKKSDIIVLFGLQGATAILATIISRLLGKKLISVNQTLPVKYEKQRQWWVILFKKFILKNCCCHISQTSATFETLRTVYGIDDNKIYYAPFEAGANWFKKLAEANKNNMLFYSRAINPEGKKTVFFFVGNLHKFKGIETIIMALSVMDNKARENVACLFAGPEEPSNKDGGTISHYVDFAKGLGVDQSILFLGKLDPPQLIAAYNESHVVMLPTYRDMFAKVMVEGAILKKPLITTFAHGAADAIVINGYNGYLINPGDFRGLSLSMINLCNEALRDEMGSKSLDLVNKICDQNKEVQGYIQAINVAISQGTK